MDAADPVSMVSWENLVAAGQCIMLFDEPMLRLLEVNFGYSVVRNAAVTRDASAFRSSVSRLSHDAHTTNMIGSVPIHAGLPHLPGDAEFRPGGALLEPECRRRLRLRRERLLRSRADTHRPIGRDTGAGRDVGPGARLEPGCARVAAMGPVDRGGHGRGRLYHQD